jgi:hypothetical protein
VVLGAFGPNDEITAIFQLIAVVLWIVAAVSVAAASRVAPSSAPSLVGAGLAFWFFPAMWNTMERAF